MPKVLAQAGTSLADNYDVEGSVAGIDELLSKEVFLLHEMGGQIFSERLKSHIILIETGLVAQSIESTINLIGLPDCPHRILDVTVISTSAGRTLNVAIDVVDPVTDREMPYLVWSNLVDAEATFRWSRDGAGPADESYLIPSLNLFPTLLTRQGDTGQMARIRMRCVNDAFGAGTNNIIALIHLCRAFPLTSTPGTPSSHGLPIPGW